MQVSIWSAFSSNHSSRFTVVGVFQSPEQAAQAAETLKGLLRPIVDWYNQPENADALEEWQHSSPDPSPPELAIAEQLGIPWTEVSLDWLWYEAGHQPIKAVDNIVLIDGSESVLGAHPADELMRRVGGQVWVDGYVDGNGNQINTLAFNLTCTAPDEATAQAIESETRAYLDGADENGFTGLETPWRRFGGPTGYSSFQGRVQRTERSLVISGELWHMTDGYPAMLAFLRDRGCTNIRHEFTVESYFRD